MSFKEWKEEDQPAVSEQEDESKFDGSDKRTRRTLSNKTKKRKAFIAGALTALVCFLGALIIGSTMLGRFLDSL